MYNLSFTKCIFFTITFNLILWKNFQKSFVATAKLKEYCYNSITNIKNNFLKISYKYM